MTSAQIIPNIGDEAQRVIADNDNSVDGTSSGVAQKPPEASKSPDLTFKVSSYFEDDKTESESPTFYKAVLQTVTPTSLILGVAGLFTAVQLITLFLLGVGETAMCIVNPGIGPAIANYGILTIVWREDTHPQFLKPGTKTFFGVMFLNCVYLGTCYYFKQKTITYPNQMNADDYDFPYQPVAFWMIWLQNFGNGAIWTNMVRDARRLCVPPSPPPAPPVHPALERSSACERGRETAWLEPRVVSLCLRAKGVER